MDTDFAITAPPTTGEILDLAKQASGAPSDYKLALMLGIEPSTIGHYRKGRSRPDDDIAQRLADMANLDRGYVVACIHAERAGTATARELWERVAARLRPDAQPIMGKHGVQGTLAIVAAVILSLLYGVGGGPDGGALSALLVAVDLKALGSVYYVYYEMCLLMTSRCLLRQAPLRPMPAIDPRAARAT